MIIGLSWLVNPNLIGLFEAVVFSLFDQKQNLGMSVLLGSFGHNYWSQKSPLCWLQRNYVQKEKQQSSIKTTVLSYYILANSNFVWVIKTSCILSLFIKHTNAFTHFIIIFDSMKRGNYYKLIVYSVCVSVSVYKKKKTMKICPLFNKNRIRIDEP